MKKVIGTLLVLAFIPFDMVMAQDVEGKQSMKAVNEQHLQHSEASIAHTKAMEVSEVSRFQDSQGLSLDSLQMPMAMVFGRRFPLQTLPFYGFGGNRWLLHKGLNLSLDASVFAGLGKNNAFGSGFSQQITAMYANPLSDKLTMAVGGYYNNLYYSRGNYQSGGIRGVLSYQFNDKLQAYVYAQKSILKSKHIPYPLVDMHSLGDKIGAGILYQVNKNITMEFSVEKTWLPTTPYPTYFDTYNYPVPLP